MIILYGILLVLWLYVLWTRRHVYVLSWKMPGPPAYLPLVGNILSMWNEEGWFVLSLLSLLLAHFKWLFFGTENSKYLDEISQKYPSPVRVWMGPNLYVFIHDAESAEQVLKGRTTLSKPKVYEAIADALGADGLFSSNGNFTSSANILVPFALCSFLMVTCLAVVVCCFFCIFSFIFFLYLSLSIYLGVFRASIN